METRTPQIPLPNHNSHHNGEGTIIEADQSIFKVYLFASCTILLALGFSILLNIFIARGGSGYFFLAFGTGLFFLAFFLLSVVLIKSSSINYGILTLSVAAFLIGSYANFSRAVFFGSLFTLFFFLVAYYVSKREMEVLLRIRLWRISKGVLPKAILGLAIFVSCVSYGRFGATDWAAPQGSFISERVFEVVIAPAVSVVQKIVPEFDLHIGLGDMIDRIALREVTNDPRLTILTPSLKKEVTTATAAELKKQIEQYVGTPMDWNQSVLASLRQALLAKLSGASPQVQSRVPAGVAILFFLLIMSLTGIIRYLATCIAFVLYEAFMALGFSVVLLETRSREIIILK